MDKRIVCTSLVSVLLLSTMLLTGMQKVEAEGTPVVYVDPPTSYAALGQTFSVNVSIANVTDLYGYGLRLYYNTTILDAIELVMHPFLNEPTFVVAKEINDEINATHGRVWLGVASLWPAEPVNGSGTLATITFEVAGVGACVLDLHTKLASAPTGDPIVHSTEDGYFVYTPLEHDIAAFLDIPVYHLTPGDSALLNATVLNGGLNNETDVELQLLINGSVVNSTVIDFLQVDSSYTISYLWTTPIVDAIYKVTAYAYPVPDEDFTLNNMKSVRVPVSYVIRVPFHYQTIQEAIDRASSGATILVSTGTYYEWLTIYKSLTLVGEESSMPVIDGSGVGYVIKVRADSVDISKFTIQNGDVGISLRWSECNTIKDNTITNNRIGGIYLFNSYNNSISGNTVSNNGFGVYLDEWGYNTVNGNMITNNTYDGIWGWGTISGNTVTNNKGTGISGGGAISGNTVSNNGIGISGWGTISGNTVTNNNGTGIIGGGTISGNTVTNNKGTGIIGRGTISGNTVSNNGGGIALSSNYSTVEDNMITNNTGAGIYLYGYEVLPPQCCNNTIIGNTISDNGIGIYANYTENNVIYHNSFINNAEQVCLEVSNDIWDNGCEGNYWSDYAGEDLDGDGIGDTFLPHLGVDHYPLMSPYIEGDVNHDAIVDIFDLVIIAIAYGARPGDPNWNPHADLNGDDFIDISDIVIAATQFGEKW